MKNVLRRLSLFVLLLFLVTRLVAEAADGRARIAFFEPACSKPDTTLAAVLGVVSDTIELSLICLERFDVRRLPSVDPVRELEMVRAYCADNRIDQAIAGNASARKGGGYSFRLMVYDRLTDSIALVRDGASRGTLDVFDVTDALVASVLDRLSGTHLLFGSLAVETYPPGAAVSVNGKEVGFAPVALRGLPVGTMRIAAYREEHEEAAASVAVIDGETTTASLTLTRSVGKCAVTMPEDAAATIRSREIGERRFIGPQVEFELPTGEYDLQATCPGLALVSGRMTIRRGETTRWLPWQKGYLVVESSPSGAEILVDGEARGSSPVVVEVEPGLPHTMELRQEKYHAYRAKATVAPGSKSLLSATLTPLSGSIRVETNLHGAIVSVNGVHRKQAPCTFDGLAPGPYEVVVEPLLLERRYYACERRFTVEVRSSEETTVSKTLVPGKAHLKLLDAPWNCTVTADGILLDPIEAFYAGVEIPAGMLDIEVTSPAMQKWSGTVSVSDGGEARLSVQSLTNSVPRRTVKIDGNVDDWEGLAPQWFTPEVRDLYPDQPGTRLTKAYLCRDDRFLYARMDFADGTPTMNLSKDIRGKLSYIMKIYMENRDTLTMDITFVKGQELEKSVRINNPATGRIELGKDIRFRTGASSLEIAVRTDALQKYLAKGPFDMEIMAGLNGKDGWVNFLATGAHMIDFVN